MSKAILGYWDIRGLAEPARLMLEFCGVNYEDKRYVSGNAPNFDRSSWLNEKFNLGLDFPNLPYYIDGDVKLSESFAIMKHIARKNNCLLPSTDLEKSNCDMLEGVVTDFRREFAMMCYMPNFDANKSKFFDTYFPQKMSLFEKYLGNNKWLSGNTLTYVDFAFAEMLDHIRLMEPTSLFKYENVAAYLNRFFKNEKIDAYRQSGRFKKFPINGRMAHWGGNDE